MKILKHIWRVLSTHSGPYQGLNMITTDIQNCLNNFHFQLSLSQHNYLQKRGLQVYGGLTLTCNSRLPLPMDGRHSLHLGKNIICLEKKELGSALLRLGRAPPGRGSPDCRLKMSDHHHPGKLLMLFTQLFITIVTPM